MNGKCEVVDKLCIWVGVYERAKAAGRMADLMTYIPQANRSLSGTSSWINYFLNRDSRPGKTPPLPADANAGDRGEANPSAADEPLVKIDTERK